MRGQFLQKGVSLIELMLSLTLGLVILMALGSMYQSASNSNRDNLTISGNSETARQVFLRLEHDFKRAGFVDVYDKPVSPFTGASTALGVNCPTHAFVQSNPDWNKRYEIVLGNKNIVDIGTIYLRWIDDGSSSTNTLIDLDSAFMTPIGYISCGTMRPVFACDSGMVGQPDINTRASCASGSGNHTIEIAYQAAYAGDNGSFSSLPDSAQDCTYQEVAKHASGSNAQYTNGFVINRYYVSQDTSNNNEPSLFCQGNASKSPRPLVSGVNEMVFRYIMTAPETDSSKTLRDSSSGSVVTQYQNAAGVEASDLDWSGVVGVEVCLVIATTAENISLAQAQGNNRPTCARDGNGNFAADVQKERNDRFYERYVRTFSLPNGLYSPIN